MQKLIAVPHTIAIAKWNFDPSLLSLKSEYGNKVKHVKQAFI
jgi:hypothetical protein